VQQPGLLLIPPVNSRCPLLGRGPLSEQAPRHLAGGAAPPEIVEGDVIAAAGQDVDRIGQAFDDQVWQRDHFASWVTWNFLRDTVEVRRQVKLLANNKQILGRPKGSKTRTIPLAASVRDLLAAYLAARPARNVTLPWGDLDGKPTTVALILNDTGAHGAESKLLQHLRLEAGAPEGERRGLPRERDARSPAPLRVCFSTRARASRQ